MMMLFMLLQAEIYSELPKLLLLLVSLTKMLVLYNWVTLIYLKFAYAPS